MVAVSQRAMTQKRSAYDFEQVISRNSTILEAYKFLGDYQDLVPYGLNASIALKSGTRRSRSPTLTFNPTPWHIVF